MDDARPVAPLAFLGDPLPRWVDRRAVTIEPGGTRPYDESEWRDALVIVETGEVVLECGRGGFTTFRAGDVLWLAGVPLRRMHNHGPDPTVIVAISRRGRDERSTEMTTATPRTELDERYSSNGVVPTSWDVARKVLSEAEVFWISTVRPDGRPHVTPIMTVMLGGSLYFCTGSTERKAHNLEHNPNVAVTTGSKSMQEGLDLVIEGTARQVTDGATLRAASDAYEAKYHAGFTVRGDALYSEEGGEAPLFEVVASKGFGFGKGEEHFSQTRWTFESSPGGAD